MFLKKTEKKTRWKNLSLQKWIQVKATVSNFPKWWQKYSNDYLGNFPKIVNAAQYSSIASLDFILHNTQFVQVWNRE